MNISGVFEAGMLICWGASWPVAAYKTFKAKRVEGKSLTFMCLIILGYIFGILHKIFFTFDWVIWLYILNMFFVVCDMCLYFKYKNKSN